MKEIFENYRENPSEDVWKRLNDRLDAEMPVRNELAGRSRRKSWIWAAAAVAVLLIGGLVFFTMVRQSAGNGQQMAQNETKQDGTVQSETPVKEDVAVVEMVTASSAAVPAESETVRSVESSRGAATPVSREAVSSPGTDSRQMLAESVPMVSRQLSEDPALQTASLDMVDWSGPSHLSIPNQFTPNSDSVNDFFVIEGMENYSSPKLVVQDMSNRVVYQSNDYNNTWDGENCPAGVYTYELTYSYNGIENQASGKVRIIRP